MDPELDGYDDAVDDCDHERWADYEPEPEQIEEYLLAQCAGGRLCIDRSCAWCIAVDAEPSRLVAQHAERLTTNLYFRDEFGLDSPMFEDDQGEVRRAAARVVAEQLMAIVPIETQALLLGGRIAGEVRRCAELAGLLVDELAYRDDEAPDSAGCCLFIEGNPLRPVEVFHPTTDVARMRLIEANARKLGRRLLALASRLRQAGHHRLAAAVDALAAPFLETHPSAQPDVDRRHCRRRAPGHLVASRPAAPHGPPSRPGALLPAL